VPIFCGMSVTRYVCLYLPVCCSMSDTRFVFLYLPLFCGISDENLIVITCRCVAECQINCVCLTAGLLQFVGHSV